MAIYLTENFHLNSDQPFDVRAVVGSQSYYLTKDDILYKYPGLRVWDFTVGGSGSPFVWNGATWSSENSIGAVIPVNTGNLNYVAKFTTDGTNLGRSLIYDTNTHIGIGLTAGDISPGSLINGLHVKGNIKTNNNFIGDGSQITQINATNITSGILTLNRLAVRALYTPSVKYFLNLIDNIITWEELNTDPFITLETASSATHYINFTSLSNGQDNINASTSLRYIPSKEQILNGFGSSNFPSYSFNGNDDKGMFWNNGTSELTLKASVNGGFTTIFDGGLSINHRDYPQISFRNSTSNRLLWVSNSNILLFRENASVVDDKKVWHESNLYHLRQVNVDNKLEILRNSNSSTTSAYGVPITGIYSYNLVNDTVNMQPSLSTLFPTIANKHKYWSNIVIGNGTNGSFQIAGNWYGASASDREMLVRSLDQSTTNWSEWSRVCLNESQSFRWSMGKTHSTRDMLKVWMENNLPKTIKTGTFDISGAQLTTPTLIPYNTSLASKVLPGISPFTVSATDTTRYDITGIRFILDQPWHNLEVYDVYYIIHDSDPNGSRVTIWMIKNSKFIENLHTEWFLAANVVSSGLTWVLNDTSNANYRLANPVFMPMYSNSNNFMNTSSTANNNRIAIIPIAHRQNSGFSAIDVYVDEIIGGTQRSSLSITLQQRGVSNIPI